MTTEKLVRYGIGIKLDTYFIMMLVYYYCEKQTLKLAIFGVN